MVQRRRIAGCPMVFLSSSAPAQALLEPALVRVRLRAQAWKLDLQRVRRRHERPKGGFDPKVQLRQSKVQRRPDWREQQERRREQR